MIYHGDSLEVLKTLPENSVDAVVTDPPYGLKFMGKKWDYELPSVDLWREVVRVLKPGGYLLSFGGTRTYHRLVVAIEDAGFEIRDQLQWIFGSGFPKSMDVSKAMDKAAGAEREVVATRDVGPDHRGSNYKNAATGDRMIADITKPATPDAIQWQGWGTALKPANEPIVLARKPLSESTVAKNVLEWGTGALNIDISRIAGETIRTVQGGKKINGNNFNNPEGNGEVRKTVFESSQGRWPANVMFDEDAAAMLDAQSVQNVKMHHAGNKSVGKRKDKNTDHQLFNLGNGVSHVFEDKTLGASRFFYCAKSSKAERNSGLEGMPLVESGIKNDSGRGFSESDPHKTILNQNHHPTVKPIKLMEYLIRLVTPPNGIVLDPFMGSGSTGVACKNLGFEFIGIEMSEEYVEIAKKRINNIAVQGELDVRTS